jgi:hypothetical protein
MSDSMALKGSNGGAVIVPGNGQESALIHRVRGLGGLRPMPPAGPQRSPPTRSRRSAAGSIRGRRGLTPSPTSMTPSSRSTGPTRSRRTPVPAVKNGSWVRNPIDSFVLARQEKEGLRPLARPAARS